MHRTLVQCRLVCYQAAMLTALRIQNFAIIDELEVRFTPGFNVLTGETGAGKSILVDALHLVLGGRARAEVIRTGCDEATVEALFTGIDLQDRLASLGIPVSDPGELLIRRVINRSGRGRAWINGSLATVGLLEQICQDLVDISGQHEHVSLLNADLHLSLLDGYAGLQPEVERYRQAYDRFLAKSRERVSIALDDAERARRIDYLAFQLDEIDQIDPQDGEDQTLEQDRKRLAAAGHLKEVAHEAERVLYAQESAVVDQLKGVLARLTEISMVDPALGPVVASLKTAQVEIEEAARSLLSYGRGIDADPAKLTEIDDRLQLLKKLCRKHGGSLTMVLERGQQVRTEMQEIERHAQRLAQLDQECDQHGKEALQIARQLSQKRQQAAGKFASSVEAELGRLAMEQTVFQVAVKPTAVAVNDHCQAPVQNTACNRPDALCARDSSFGRESSARDASSDRNPSGQNSSSATRIAAESAHDGQLLTAQGIDSCELLISPNPGEEVKPLARIASGGELSRVMLAIKQALANTDPVATYIFDEVDSGIGGAVAEVVGRLLKKVSQNRQVLCITHLPQIAACGDHHFIVEKSLRDGRTVSSITPLDNSGRTREVARMLAGVQITDAALKNAQQMLQSSHRKRR